MTEKQLVKLSEVEGIQHGQDDFWMRPLLRGKGLYIYVAYVPPGADMPATGGRHPEKEGFERAIYMLEGSLEITYGEEKFEITPEMGLLVSLETPLGIKNSGRETASFIMTYSPPPHPEIKSIEELRKKYAELNCAVRSPAEMEELRERGKGKRLKCSTGR